MENTSGISKVERNWAMFAHLSSFLLFTGIPLINLIAPLIIWQIRKEDMPFAGSQAKECLNFQISVALYTIISVLLAVILVGFVIMAIVILMAFILTIIAAIEANNGVEYKYPLTIRFIK